MKITTAGFRLSVASLSALPPESAPEIVFVGRSNVGKSSLLNTLTGTKGLAKTSATPGKTRLINFFTINEAACSFVDLPGYGYAAVSRTEKAQWGDLLAGYLASRHSIVLVALLIDARHPGMESDRDMMAFLDHYQLPYGIVLTKYDKLTQRERAAARKAMENAAANARFIVNYSSFSGLGKQALLDHFDHYISQ